VWLQAGDEVKISVTGLGTLSNKVANSEDASSTFKQITTAAVAATNNKTVENNGLTLIGSKQLFYQRRGAENGPPILFIHGLGATSEYFYPIMTRLGDSYTYLLFDLEGHGLSPTLSTSKLSIASFASDAYEILKKAGVSEQSGGLIVIGHSLGGLVAIRLALDHPDLVKTLILQGPGPSPLPQAASEATYTRARTARDKGMLGVVDGVVGMGTSDHSKSKNPLGITAARIMLLGQDPEGYAKACTALADSHKDTLDIAALKAKTLIVTGEEDKVSQSEMCRKMKDKMTNCEEVVVLPNVAHLHLLENPEEVCSAVAKFLGQ
jgi:pimeloyl-ACP methyl ester carboxylesterase